MEDNAGGMVRRLALKTRFSEMGWGSTPLSSAKVIESWMSGLNRHPAKVLFVVIRAVGSNPTLTATIIRPTSTMVVHWFCNPVMAVRFCRGAPTHHLSSV